MPKRKKGITGDSARKRAAELQRERRRNQDESTSREIRTADAEYRRRIREQETVDERNERTNRDAERHRAAIQEETEEETNERRNRDAERHRAAIQEETEEESNERRTRDSQRHQEIRERETEEQAIERRTQDADHHRQVRSQENIQQHEERLIRNRIHRATTDLHNIARSANTLQVDRHTCGNMDNSCQHCNGLFFLNELNTRRKYKACCQEGKIVEIERNYPQDLRNLMTGEHRFSSNFFQHIRRYNSLFSFASMGANLDTPQGSGPYCFRIHGAIYHKTSNLRPAQPGQEKYAQLYILDSDQALRQRMNMATNVTLNEDLLTILDAVLRNENPYAQAYKMLKEFEEETLREEGAEDFPEIKMYIKGDGMRGEHRGRYNAPKENEVAVVFKSTDGVAPTNRDIVIHPRAGDLIHISTLNPNLEPMTYVLFFPRGEKGFEIGHGYTELQFYSHRISVRRDIFNAVLYGRKLFQQYLVDSFVKVESSRLHFHRRNQKKLRVETYMGLADHDWKIMTNANYVFKR